MGNQIYLKNGKPIWQSSWKVVGGKRCYFRSKAEFRYALYLELLKKQNHIIDWQHEAKIFHFSGVKNGSPSYRPDFLVKHKDHSDEYVEVKGRETGKDRSKWKRMAKFFPNVRLRIVRMDFFTKNAKKLKAIIKEWE